VVNRPWPLVKRIKEARAIAAKLGHEMQPFLALGDTLASSECRDPRCGMGATVTSDPDARGAHMLGAAITFRCAGKPNRRTLRYALRP